MWEAHGWLAVRESHREIDEGNLESIVTRIRGLIRSFAWNAGHLEVQTVNGEYFVHLACLTNHLGQDAAEVD